MWPFSAFIDELIHIEMDYDRALMLMGHWNVLGQEWIGSD